MAFDLSTAVPIKEIDDNIAVSGGFDISSARPIAADSSHTTDYDNWVKSQLDEDIKKAIHRPLNEEEISKIRTNEKQLSGAFWAAAIPYVKGAAGFFTRPFGVEPLADVTPEKQAKLKEEEPFAYTIGEIVGGIAPFIVTAPLFPQSLLGTAGVFSTVAATKEVGRQQVEESLMTSTGEKALDIAKETLKGAAYSPIWHYAGALKFVGRPYASALTRAGVKGVGTATLSAVFGNDLESSLKQGGMITALSLIFEAPGLAKTALGRGIIKQSNRIAKEKGLVNSKYEIDVDRLDAVSTRQSLFKLVKGFYSLMKHKVSKSQQLDAKTMAIQKYIKPQQIEIVNPQTLKVSQIKPEIGIVTKADIPPAEPTFPDVKEEFLKQPKKKTTILQYFTPAEYHLKELGFDAEIGQPVREALQNFSIELMKKNDLIKNIQDEHFAQIPKEDIKKSTEKLWQYMDKGIPKGDTSIEANISRKLRPETQEMLKRMNKVAKEIGKPEIKEVQNYILHMLKPELLNEIYSKGVIPPELAKVMEYVPNKNIFLRTAQQRKGVPEKWLSKNPYELMRAMYAIDLRYIHLQEALHKIDPYVKAVKGYVSEEGEYWSPETYKYLDDWVKQAIKMRPSNWDTLTDNMLEYTIAPLLRKAGIKVSHMPWRDLVNFLAASAHTGALGMRVRPILRNLVQSTFDWVMYGTKPYTKASGKFMTKEGHDILKQSKVWQTRVPYEAQDLATLRKIFKIGSIGYRYSDLHNVGKGILTRYYHAIDDLKMSHEEALKFADNDLPATQWSYRREDLPRAYWTTTGRAFWTLGSWWMNFYTRLLPELSRRAFTGKDVNGRTVPTSERLGIMRLFVLIGLLFAVKKKSKELTGTAIDYTGQIKPTPLREAPIAQLGKGFIEFAQGITDDDERKRTSGLRTLANTAKIFIPWYLASRDLWQLVTGKKDIQEFLFYTGRKKKEKARF